VDPERSRPVRWLVPAKRHRKTRPPWPSCEKEQRDTDHGPEN
jgi:hypothetical protein